MRAASSPPHRRDGAELSPHQVDALSGTLADPRATGTAAALGFGRLGAILSAFVGTAVIAAGGAQGYYGLLGGAMLGSAVMLLLLRKHIPAGARPIAS